MREVVLGLDLSTAGLGMVAVGTDWNLDWRAVRYCTLAAPLKRNATQRDKVARLRALALDVRVWAISMGITRAWAESVPTFGFNIVTLASVADRS